jgi:hypothetical protein
VPAVAGQPSSSRAAGQALSGLGRRPAQPGVGRRPARPGSDRGLCRPNSASCFLPVTCRAGRPRPVALSGTGCDSISAPDRREEGEKGVEERERERRRGRRRGGGQTIWSAGGTCCRGLSLYAWAAGRKCLRARTAARVKQARVQSCAGTSAEPRPQAHTDTIRHTQSHASTSADVLLHEQ